MSYCSLRISLIIIIIIFISAKPLPPPVPTNPCIPSPCGPNSECRVHGDSPACSCSLNYIGTPPNCRPECTINPECPSHLACINQKCADPCPGSCGSNAQCSVINHTPICTCITGYTGDPFTGCLLIQGRNCILILLCMLPVISMHDFFVDIHRETEEQLFPYLKLDIIAASILFLRPLK